MLMNGFNDLTEIERLKLLKSMRVGFRNVSDFENHFDTLDLNMNKVDTFRRIEGLLLEDEFLLLCTLMHSCLSINALEQLSFNDRLKVPDFMVTFDLRDSLYKTDNDPSTFSAFVEVKTTEFPETKKLGRGFIDKYKSFSDIYNMPLLFASRLKIDNQRQIWCIHDFDSFNRNQRKCTIENQENSISHLLLSDCYITSLTELTIVSEYTETPKSSSHYFKGLGYLDSLYVCCPNQKFSIEIDDFMFNLFLDCFPQHILKVSTKNGRVKRVTRIEPMTSELLSDMLLRANFSMLDSNKDKYNCASRFLSLMESNQISPITKVFFGNALNFFSQNHCVFMTTKIGHENSWALSNYFS